MFLKERFRALFTPALLLALAMANGLALAIDLDEHPKVKAVADRLVTSGHYQQSELDVIFAQARVKQSVLDAMMSPAEYKFTWGKYRKLFLKPDRIQQGVDFWKANKAQLERAEKEYGVPAEIIVAIIGVESKYGKFKGKYKVLDSLVSLVTGFPRRSKFFASELEEFLILSKENQLDATKILGSYAGAVGYPQFISSSYRNYAVDFNKDGSTDLIGQVDDAIGSIANYFIENGWQPGEPVTSVSTDQVTTQISDLASRKRKVQHTAEFLRSKGATLADDIAGKEKLGVLMLNANPIVPNKKIPDTVIVRAGDTACGIARKHKVSCKEVFKLNKLNSKGDIFRDQRLKLPVTDQSQTAVKSTDKTGWKVNQSASADKAKAEDDPQPIYFYTHRNFYAITQYNHSVLYAMAVYDLSEAIAESHAQSLSKAN